MSRMATIAGTRVDPLSATIAAALAGLNGAVNRTISWRNAGGLPPWAIGP